MKKLLLLFIFSISIYGYSRADIIGSDTLVSVLSAFTFPQSPIIANKIASFGWVQNGFTLTNSATTCVFNSVFPVTGIINLHGGTLNLSSDLIFANNSTLNGLGTIIGNGHVVNFAPGTSSLPSDTQIFQDAAMVFNSDLTITSTITFKGVSSINGNGNALILGVGGAIVVDANAILVLRNLVLKGVKNSNVQCINDNSSLQLHNVIWNQSGNTTFANGSIKFIDQVDFVGLSTFFYTSSQTSTIDSFSEWNVTKDMTLSIGRKTINSVQPLSFTDNSSILKFEQSTLAVTTNGLQFTKGKIFIDREVDIGTSFSNGLTFGDGTLANDCGCEIFSGAKLKITTGVLNYKNVGSSSWKMDNNMSTLIINDLATLNLFQTLDITAGSLIFGNNTTLGRAAGAQLLGGITVTGNLSYVGL